MIVFDVSSYVKSQIDQISAPLNGHNAHEHAKGHYRGNFRAKYT